MKKRSLLLFSLLGIILLTTVSALLPKKETIVVLPAFDAEKFVGKWYEIARMDYKWEKNLNNVSAIYTLEGKGLIKVWNKGYNTVKNKWERTQGLAKPASINQNGALKVSFLGPFYSPYNIVAIDRDYKYALVVGEDQKYMWILSREKTVPKSVQNDYLKQALGLGFNIGNLVWVKQDRS